MLYKIAVGVGVVATIIGFFNLDLAIKIMVNAIIVACFVTVLIGISKR